MKKASNAASVRQEGGGNYKEIVIDTTPSAADVAAISFFNQHANPDHVYLSHTKNAVVVHVRQIDRAALAPLLRTHKQSALLVEVGNAIDNIKSYGIKSGFKVYVDYNQERKVQGRAKKEAARGKHYYANAHSFSKQNNALPQKFSDTIICGDSLQTLAQLPDNCVDLIFTSPPYNFGLDYANAATDSEMWEQYFQTLFAIFDEGIRVLKYGGRFIVNVQPLYSDYIPSHHVIGNYFMQKQMIWKGEILWEKNNYNCKYSAWGSWKSPSNPYLKGTWEFVEVFCKGSLKKEGHKDNVDIDAEEFKAWVISRWSIAPERKMKEYGHPAMFPEKLVERVLKLFSYRGDVVLDPFNGAGTTTAVAKRFGRHYLGIDISKPYCQTAKKRIAQVKPAAEKML